MKRGLSNLTFVLVVGRDGEDGMLDVLVLVDLGLIQLFVEERRVVVLIRDPDSDELCDLIGLTAVVGPRRGRSVLGLNFQRISTLQLSVEDGLRAHFARLHVDLEKVVALGVLLDVVEHLVVWKCAVSVDRVHPVDKKHVVKRARGKLSTKRVIEPRG